MEFFFCNETYNKKKVGNLIQWFLFNHGPKKTSNLLDKLKILSFQYATKGGLSIGIEDLKIPRLKSYLIKNALTSIKKNDKKFLLGEITATQKFDKMVDIWSTTDAILIETIISNFRQTNILNPIYIAALSGARGNISQVKQLVGMRGLMSDSGGEIIDIPIESNFKEGLNITEYLISCYGARKGLIDTALKTSNSGYLTRRLVEISHSIVIKKDNCNTFNGIFIEPLIKNKKTYLNVKQRILGRILATNLIDKKSKILISKNQDICSYLVKKIIKEKNKKSKIYVKSPLTCQSQKSVCQLCYGWNLTHGKLVEIGETVGIIAAQSIGEPGTQLTMRTFHTGGVFYGKISEKIYSPHEGIIQYFINKKLLKNKTKNSLIEKEQYIYIKENKYNTSKIKIPPYSKILVKPNTKVRKKEVIAEMFNYEDLSNKTDKNYNYTIKELKSITEGQIFIEKKNKIWVMSGKIIFFTTLIKDIKRIKKVNPQTNNNDLNIKPKKTLKKRITLNIKFVKNKVNNKNIKLLKTCFIENSISNIRKKGKRLNKIIYFRQKEKERQKQQKIKKINPELKVLSDKRKCCFVYTQQNKKKIVNKTQKYLLGNFIQKKIKKNFIEGQIIILEKNKTTIVKGKPSLTTNIYPCDKDIIDKNSILSSISEKQSKTEDIVQGLPKIEQLLEARITKGLTLLLNSPKIKLKEYFSNFSEKYKNNIATKKSRASIQQYLRDNIQLVYQTQNISISDKHLEIIIRQMTNKVIILKEGETQFLIGEKANILQLEKINKKIKNKAIYEPIIEGITRVSLETESFISAASFQQTTKTLIKAATEGKIDWIYGLKEQIIIGNLLNIGTGIKSKSYTI